MKRCERLEWEEEPQLVPCAVGEPADYRGLRVMASYDDGSSETVAVDRKMFNESSLHTEGSERKCTVSYAGKRLSVFVPLLATHLDHIEVIASDPIKCCAGEVFERSKVTVIAHYGDGQKREVDLYKTFPFGPLSQEDTALTIRYGRCNATVQLSVETPEEENQGQNLGYPADSGGGKAGASDETAGERGDLRTPGKAVPDFYPSTFSFRFRDNDERVFFSRG